MSENTQFKTIDPLYGFPALTTLLYKVCDNDEHKFEEACRLVELFVDQAERDLIESMGDPVVKVVPKFGDPEAFGVRGIIILEDIQKLPYGTSLYKFPKVA